MIELVPELQTPPEVASVSVTDPPTQTAVGPLIEPGVAGAAVTVTVTELDEVPQLFVNV